LALTLLTTLLAGASLDARFLDLGPLELFLRAVHHPSVLWAGAPFALPLLFILAVHEMGHFLTARRYGIRVTWPYFLPGPPVFSLGTFGAFIRLKGAIPTRGVLMEVGVGGPLWGFLASVLTAVAGFLAARGGYHAPADLGMDVHLPLAYWILQVVLVGDPRWVHTLFENPMLLAAWLGFFVQGLNLIPVGQLDGGHVLYAFAKGRHRWASTGVALAMLAYAVIQPQWLVWAALLFFVLGLRHPPTLMGHERLTPRQVALGVCAVAIFFLCFLPAPFAT
jgi:membrane-associated protease RseP (regulator of RpoE activity)